MTKRQISEERLQLMKDLRASGESLQSIALRLGVSRPAVNMALNLEKRRKWAKQFHATHPNYWRDYRRKTPKIRNHSPAMEGAGA